MKLVIVIVLLLLLIALDIAFNINQPTCKDIGDPRFVAGDTICNYQGDSQ
jgi:hypothetical protein